MDDTSGSMDAATSSDLKSALKAYADTTKSHYAEIMHKIKKIRR